MTTFSRYMTTTDAAECDPYFKENLKELKDDPNNVPFDFKTVVIKREVVDPAEFVVFKRRQRTKDGAEYPESPCDDKGLPLYVNSKGDLVTRADGNEIAWGGWMNAMETGVSVEQINVPKRCWARRIRDIARWRGDEPSTEKEVKEGIERDKNLHDKQQDSRKSKVNVEYKYEKMKDATTHDEFTCKIDREKARDFPESWKDVPFKMPDVMEMNPIIISFSIRDVSPKTGKDLSTTHGVGTFAGRKKITEDLLKNKIFGWYALEKNAKDAGFTPRDAFSASTSFLMDVPGTSDACVIKTSSKSFKYARDSYNTRRLMNERGQRSIAGDFVSVDFEVVKKSRPGIYGDKIAYEKKAPKKSVDFCHEKFSKVANGSIVKLVDAI